MQRSRTQGQPAQGVEGVPTVFTYCAEKKVRTVKHQEQTWFVAQDVCDILELNNNRKALIPLDEDEKLMSPIVTSGQNRQMWTVNESGLYHLIFISRKPEAKKFLKWVTSVVLPSIRKQGYYGHAHEAMIQEQMAALSDAHKLMDRLYYSLDKAHQELEHAQTALYKLRQEKQQPQKEPKLYTVNAYAKYLKLRGLNLQTMSVIGQIASLLSKNTYKIGKVHDQRFGTINAYEEAPLRLAFQKIIGH